LRDSEVSRKHVAVEIRDLEVELVDLKATNGSWFEGKRIDRVKLSHQDEFTLGSTTLMLIVTTVRDA
jgi:pSer/pThr/pTyr-binding forkhead associated (FHA) protein